MEVATELGGLLRPHAGFFAICVTNGPDGLEVAPMPFISSLLSRMPAQRAFSLVARLVDPDTIAIISSCGGEVEHGPLTALVEQTNGSREEICTPDWATSLERIGKSAFGYRTRFYLHQRPDFSRGPLRVWIDELEVPSVDLAFGSNLWSYAADTPRRRASQRRPWPAPRATKRTS